MKQRSTKADKRRHELMPLGNKLAAILRPVYDRHREQAACDDCAAIRTRKDVMAILDEAIDALRPNLIDLCAKHQPPDEPQPGPGNTPTGDDDDGVPF